MSTAFILTIYWWNNQVKSIKMTYRSVVSLYFEQNIYDRKGDKTMTIFSGECVMERIWW